MKITIVVDANIILSALLGGKPSFILFDGRFQFATTQFTISEVKKYLPKLAKKLHLPKEENLLTSLNLLPLSTYETTFYKNKISKAKNMIGDIDEKDVDVLALALELDAYLWSQDKDFEKCGYSKLLKTYNFIE